MTQNWRIMLFSANAASTRMARTLLPHFSSVHCNWNVASGGNQPDSNRLRPGHAPDFRANRDNSKMFRIFKLHASATMPAEWNVGSFAPWRQVAAIIHLPDSQVEMSKGNPYSCFSALPRLSARPFNVIMTSVKGSSDYKFFRLCRGMGETPHGSRMRELCKFIQRMK